MRKKFKIFYGKNSTKFPEKAGQEYKPKKPYMLTMNNQGIFFIYSGYEYYPSIFKLSREIGEFDVVWGE
jgi:hypothetical protein